MNSEIGKEGMPERVRIAITDDHQMFIEGMLALLAEESWIETVGTAANGKELLVLLQQKQVDVVLMDVHMPEMDGLEATKTLVKDYPQTKVLMLTMAGDPKLITQLVTAGAHGYILKNTNKSELLEAIRKLANGDTYYSPEVAQTLIDSMRRPKPKPAANTGAVALTKREKEVLRLIALEFTTLEIAEKLFISENTVETHRKNLLSKLQARNSAGLVRYALESGLMDETKDN